MHKQDSTKKTWGVIAGLLLTLLAANASAALSTAEAQEQAANMVASGQPMSEVVVALLEHSFTLAEATAIIVQQLPDNEQKQALARAALCMSRDLEEAEAITESIASVPGTDQQTVAIFVSEQVKYSRSNCIESFIPDRPPLTESGGEARPAIDTSPSQ